jgi:hypothetical protein
MESPQASFPLGQAGRLEAGPLTNAIGNHAVLVREGEQPRALVTVEKGSADRHRVVVVPLDTDVELRVDGDALAIWLSQGSVGPAPSNVPGWANAIGFALVILAVGFMVLGSVTFFGWLFRSLGWL